LQSAVSQVFNLPTAACEQRSADYKSAIRQIRNLRYAKHVPGILPAEAPESDSADGTPAARWRWHCMGRWATARRAVTLCAS